MKATAEAERSDSSVRSDPLVSVIVPTYGRPDLLGHIVDCVVRQTYRPVELVVVDDCSPEPVGPTLSALAADVDVDIRCLRHGTNRGANAARNTGIEAARGEFLAFLDDDDEWDPEKLERQIRTFRRADSSVGLVYTGQRYEVDGAVTWELRPTLRGRVTERLLTGESLGTFSTIVVRSDVVETVGLPDERFPCWQDREWPIRVSQHYAFEVVPDPLVVHASSDRAQISSNFEAKRDVAYPLLVETFRPVAAAYGPPTERRFLAATARELARVGLTNGYYRDAVRFFRTSLRYDPRNPTTYLYLLASLGGPVSARPARLLKRTAVRLSRRRRSAPFRRP